MKEKTTTQLDHLLDLLADEVAERLRAESRPLGQPAAAESLTSEGPEPTAVEIGPPEAAVSSQGPEPGTDSDLATQREPVGLEAALGRKSK